MLRFWMLPGLALSLLFSVTIGLVNARPYQNANLHRVVDTLFTCSPLCWQNIRPGVTHISEIQFMLSRHAWVEDVSYTPNASQDNGLLTWTWRNVADTFINPAREGQASVRDGLVQWVRIPTRFAFGDFWLTLGQPQTGQTLSVFQPARYVHHYVAYDASGWQVRYGMPCAWGPDDLWRTRVDIWLGGAGSVPMPDYQHPSRAECAVR